MPNAEGEVTEQPRRSSAKETPQNIAKLKELRGYAPFIKNVVKTYKRQMTIEQWKKLHMLAELLESKTTATEFFGHSPTHKLNKIEGDWIAIASQ